jgi:homoserine O-acetyltransferase
MNSHDIARGRGSTKKAIQKIKAEMLLVGIDSDRLFPVPSQEVIAESGPKRLFGNKLFVIKSDYGHDGFLIEAEKVGKLLKRLLSAKS